MSERPGLWNPALPDLGRPLAPRTRDRAPAEARVAALLCQETRRPFGVRLVSARQRWVATDTAPLAAAADHDSPGAGEVVAGIYLSARYPGCPHCGRASFFRCRSCGQAACCGPEQGSAICPGCDRRIELRGTIDGLPASREPAGRARGTQTGLQAGPGSGDRPRLGGRRP